MNPITPLLAIAALAIFSNPAFSAAPPGEAQARGVSGTAFLDYALRKGAGGFDEHGVIHQHQRLERRAGLGALGDAELARRRVERDEGGIHRGPPPIDVEPASV